MHLGEFASAIEHFEKALSLYDPERHRDDAFVYAQNPGVAMRCFAAWALWFLGQPDQALNRMQEALTLARELSEPHGLAYALSLRRFCISSAGKRGWRRNTPRKDSPFPPNTGWCCIKHCPR